MRLIMILMAVWPFLGHAQEMPQGFHDLADPGHWYDFDCCSANDCEPVNFSVITQGAEGVHIVVKPGEHKFWPEKFANTTNPNTLKAFIPYGDSRLRVSKDGQNHLCLRDWNNPSMTGDRVLCVYLSAGF